ncbi:hypothetical protein AB0K60_07215 [Thermopolyspora sp. NPDC052614]|uniref:hypothetical protein n=1 Tax=Thermopolyspora sp. NPDC052614 TaxID=3155682 RepID=UPI003440FADF
MKLAFKAEISPPPWLFPVAHTVATGGGLAYLQIAHQSTAVTTAIVFAIGVSYGRLLNAWRGRSPSATRKRS